MIWKLTKLSYLGNGGITSHLNVTFKKDNAASKFGTGALLAFLAIYFVFSFFTAGAKMFVTGSYYDYASFFFTLIIIEFFFLFSSSDATFFKSDELQILSTLPVTKRELFISRVNMMLIEGYVIASLPLLGLLISTFLVVKFSLLWIVGVLFIFVTIPLFLTTISALLSLYLSEKPQARIVKRVLYYAILIGFVLAYTSIYAEGIDIVSQGTLNYSGTADNKVSIALILISIVFIVFFLAFLPLLERKFLHIKEEEGKKKIKAEKISARSVRSSLMVNDFKLITGDPAFSFELLGEVFIPIIILLVYSFMGIIDEIGDLASMMASSKYGHLILAGIVVGFGSLNGISSTSFSREGRDFYLLESLPIAKKDRILAKARLHILVVYPVDALILAVSGIFFKMPLWFYPLSLVLLFNMTLTSSLIGLFIDYNAPYLTWSKSQMAVKNNMNMIKCMCFSLLIAVLVFLPGILLSRAGYAGAISLASSAFVSLLAVLFAYSRAR